MKDVFQVSCFVQRERTQHPLERKGTWKRAAWEGKMASLPLACECRGPLGDQEKDVEQAAG